MFFIVLVFVDTFCPALAIIYMLTSTIQFKGGSIESNMATATSNNHISQSFVHCELQKRYYKYHFNLVLLGWIGEIQGKSACDENEYDQFSEFQSWSL